MNKFKKYKFNATYGIELTNSQLLKILRLDNDYTKETADSHKELSTRIDEIDGAFNCDYNGLFAFTGVIVSIEHDYDNNDTYNLITKTINEYMAQELTREYDFDD